MSQTNLIVDGQAIRVPSKTTVLEAAKAAGIYIPTLCYQPDPVNHHRTL
ncbi:MAG: (2Fe-2S)-binding protein [Desulfobacteraceae bacterium]|nr:(2Fe-2S)-binding protein [Desulfobacteraceae bacterium]